jgi:Sulfotransferase family
VSRPAPVVLDDLAAPRFTPEIVALRAAMAEMAPSCPLETDAIVAAARDQTGLHRYGDGAFVERLEILCAALRTEADLSGAGIVSWYSQLVQTIKNRLLIEDVLDRHPEIHDIEIVRPLIIAGLPRTGTTHLHNLISADPALRSLPYWESLEPVLAESERPGPGEPDPRLARTAFGLEVADQVMPYFKRMHEMTVDHVHEEIQLLAMDFSTMLFETIAPMPAWRDDYLARDQRPSYAYLKRILQAMQWLRGGTRWVLKSPQHLEQFPALVDTFPDATFIVTHRDPVSVTASMITMLAYSARIGHEQVDLHWIGRYWADRLEQMLSACVRDRDVLPADHSMDMRFDEFMADDMGMVGRIYELAAQPMNGTAEAAMTSFMADHPRGRHGGVLYDLAQFGLDGKQLRESMAFYTERFGVSEES